LKSKKEARKSQVKLWQQLERHRQRKHRTREKSIEGEERRDQITVNYTRL